MAFASVCTASVGGTSSQNSTSPRRPRTQRLNLRDPAALDAELRRFSASIFADPDVLPRQEDLLRARRGDLRYAIERYHGGFRSLRRVSSQRRRPSSSASSPMTFTHLADEIREFIETHVVPLDPVHADLSRTLFPTHYALRAAGRADLVRAVREAGGSRAVAARMQLRLHYHASTDYAGETNRLYAEIRRFVAARPKLKGKGVFPTGAELHAAGRLDIIAGIRTHGGAKTVANVMRLKLQRGRRRDAEELKKELKAIGSDALPTDATLVELGRIDVLRAIRGMGGRERAAEILGVRGGGEFAKTFFDEGFFQVEVCPDEQVLVHNEGNKVRQELQKAPVEERGGGGGALLPKDGGRRRKKHYFSSFDRLQQELMCFIFDDGVPGVMPTAQELIRAGRRDLVRAMQLHGGQKTVAARLGLIMHSMGRKKIVEQVRATVSV